MIKVHELSDVISLALDVLQDVKKALADDGKVGLVEGAGLVIGNIPGILDAAKDAGRIGDELRSIDAAGMEALADLVFPNIGFATEAKREATNRTIALLVAIAHLYQFIRDSENWKNPPKANVIPE